MIKKAAKIFLWAAIILFVLLMIAIIFLRIKFPPQKIKQLVIAQIEATINRKVSLGDIWFNPFKGFTINEAQIYQNAPLDTTALDTAVFFHSKQLHLRYRFLSLLKRALEINNILIDQPVVNLTQDKNGRWNIADLIAPDTTAQPVVADTAAEFSLPVSIKLKQFSLNNFTINVDIDQVDTVYSIRSGGVSIRVADLFLPRHSYEEFKKNVRADLQLNSNAQPWYFLLKARSSPEISEFSTNLELDAKIKISGLKNLYSAGTIALTNFTLKQAPGENLYQQRSKFSFPELASLSYRLETDAEQGQLTLHELTAKIGRERICDIKGAITDILNQPRFDLEVVESAINLENLLSLILPLLPDSVQQQRKDISIAGLASFKGTKVTGNPLSENIPEALTVNLLFSLDNFSATYVDPPINLRNLKIESRFTEIHNLHGVQQADIWVAASLDSFHLAVDTLALGYSGFNLNVTSALNADLLPDSIATRFTIKNFFEVPLDLSLRFKSIDGLNRFQASGNLTIDQLPLWNLPESSLDGLIDIALNLHAETLDQIKLEMDVASDIIELEAEPEPMVFYPMNLHGDATLATDTLFQVIRLEQFQVGINNFASALMHGAVRLNSPMQMNLIVDNLTVDHEKLLPRLPAQLMEDLESLKVTGNSKLTSQISIWLPEQQAAIIDATGQVLVQAGVEYPEAYFSLKKIDGIVNFTFNGESGKLDLQAMLDSLILEDVRDEPLRNMPLVAHGTLPDLETLKIDSSMLLVPDLMSKIFLTGQIDSLSGNVPAHFTGTLWLDSQTDTIDLLNDLKASGKLTQTVELTLRGDIAAIKGRLNIECLNLNYDNLAQIDSIVGVIHLAQQYDIEKEILIESSPAPSFFAEAGSYYYDLLRPYYQYGRDQFSFLRIGKIRVGDYFASDITFDILIDHERIEIPRFALKAYDGNMSGLIYANLHDGNPDQIEWKIKANLSQLNSAKLIPTRRLKARGAELNMNLELTGLGIDPASQLEVEGYLYVTKIGPQFTDNVLRSLDPRGTDKSINDTRRLLNWGYKPRLLSFEIKHGNLYPTIHLVKGKLLTKLIPLNLSGGKIELARIPVKFFMTNMMTESR